MTSVVAKPTDRRKERRYIVDGIRAVVDGMSCPIADISASAVRLLWPHEQPPVHAEYRLGFEIRRDGGSDRYVVRAAVVRSMQSYVVLRYAAPTADWEHRLRALDTLEATRLIALF